MVVCGGALPPLLLLIFFLFSLPPRPPRAGFNATKRGLHIFDAILPTTQTYVSDNVCFNVFCCFVFFDGKAEGGRE